MLWLLAAELRKLIRPLVWGTGLAIIGFCVLITWGGANNAHGALASPRIPDVCARAVTAQCQQVVAHAHASARAAAAATSLLAQPGEVGHVAAGMLASVPGLLLIALVAGGHWGGEWGSRTIRQLLSKQGRRTRVLTAKWLTIWVVGVATMVCCWLVLAAAAPVIVAAAGPPGRACPRVGWPGLVGIGHRTRSDSAGAVRCRRDRSWRGRQGTARHDGDHSRLDAARTPGRRHFERRAALPGVVRAGLDEL